MAISTTSRKTLNNKKLEKIGGEERKKECAVCMGMHLKALQCPKRLSLVSNFQNTFYNFLFSWLAACLLPLDSQLIISQLIITQKKKIESILTNIWPQKKKLNKKFPNRGVFLVKNFSLALLGNICTPCSCMFTCNFFILILHQPSF